MTLREYLMNCYPVTAVRYLAENLGIATEEEAKQTSKADLSVRESELLLTPEVMASRLAVLSDSEMELFERACHGPVQLAPDEEEDAQRLKGCRYAFLVVPDDTPFPYDDTPFPEAKAFRWFSADRLEVPEDAAALYETMNTPAFQERRRVTWRLVHCLDVIRTLYGSAPVSVVRRMLEEELKEEISEEELLSFYRSIPSDSNYTVYDSVTGRITYRRMEGEELEELIRQQEGKDFYIPTLAELEELYYKESLLESPAYVRYRKFLENYCNIDPEEAANVSGELWWDTATGAPSQDCVQGMIDCSGADSSCAKLILRLYK